MQTFAPHVQRPTRWRRYRRAGIVAIPTVVIALWLVFQHKPTWYRPARLDKQGVQRARRDAVAVADFISDRMVQGQPFEVTLVDRKVNEWLAAAPHAWPDLVKNIPPGVSDPAVRFDDGMIHVGAHYESRGWRVIGNLSLRASTAENGRTVGLDVDSIRGGSLPLPRAFVRYFLAGGSIGDDENDPGYRGFKARSGSSVPAIRSPQKLLEGVQVVNRFTWFNGDRPFRIRSIDCDDGVLRLWIVPL